MMFGKCLVQKANKLRKQNWSAPAIMTGLILVSMVAVFSFETIGILNKERNLDYRSTTPEKIIKVGEVKINSTPLSSQDSIAFKSVKSEREKLLYNKVKEITAKNKEENMENIMRILLESAIKQQEYENGDIEREIITENLEDLDFFDI